MDHNQFKSGQPQENQMPKKYSIPVKSRYMDSIKKASSQSNNSASLPGLEGTNHSGSNEHLKGRPQHSVANSTLIGNGNRALAASSSILHPTKPERVLKYSTPTKDVSLLAADLSVIPAGTDCESHRHKREDPAKIDDEIFEEYNAALLVEALGMLMDEQLAQCAQVADRELVTLQKAVADSTCLLSTLDAKTNSATSLADLQDDVNTCEDVYAELMNDPAFSDCTSLKSVLSEIESKLNQLPCQNVKIPSTLKDLDEIENAAAKLSNKLSSVSLKHGEEIKRVSRVKKEMAQVDALCDNLTEAHSSAEELMPIATTKVLDEISRNMMNSVISNTDITF